MTITSSRQGNSRKFLLTAMAAAVSTALGGATGTVYAQEAAEELEEIQVTGTRIRQTSGFTSPTPVTSINTDDLFTYEPGNTVTRQLSALPQFFNNVGLQQVSTAQVATSGSTSLNIRNLGTNRTLVLFDGIRVVPAAKEGAVNVDAFPTALMRSVDVVTGGASAAYGADAVGGVVNFVLDREFEGFVFDVNTGVNEAGDGEQWGFSTAGGTALLDGRLNLIGSVEARKLEGFARRADEVEAMQRWGHVTNPEWVTWRTANPSAPLAASPVPQRLTRPWVTSAVSSPTGLILAPRTPLDRMQFNMEGTAIQPFVLGDVSSVSGLGTTQTTAGGPEAMLSNDAFGGGIGGTEAENRSAFVAGQYQVTDSFSVFAQGLYGKTIASQINDRGSFLFSGQWAPMIQVDNAYLPDNVRQLMVANNLTQIAVHKNGSFVERPEVGHGGVGVKTISTVSVSGGFDWDLPFRDWHLRGVYQDGQSDRTATFGNLFRVDRAFLAMDAVRHPQTGAIVCRVQTVNPTPAQLAASPSVQGKVSEYGTPLKSPIGLDNTVRDCIPFNYLGSGNISPQALAYVQGDEKTAVGDVDQQFAEMLLTGELHEGWGPGSISFAAGATWRDQSFQDQTYPIDIDELGPPLNDPALGITGIPIGYTAGGASLHYISTLPNLKGDASVWEYFGELNVPLWEGAMFGTEQVFDTSLAFRRSDYDRSGPVESWKVGLNFQLSQAVRFRFTNSQDVREPTFSELFDAQGTNGAFRDARANGAERQISKTTGGNPNLSPEEAETITAGVVFTPDFAPWLEGLQVSLDWYDVTIDGAVGQLGEQRITDECFINNLPFACGQIEMDSNGTVTRVYDTFLNVAQATVEGYDLEVAYRMEPNFLADESESFSIRMLAGYTRERTDTPLGGRARDISGTRPSPDLTSVLTTTYGFGPWSVQLQGRYIDSTTLDGLWIEGIDVDDNQVPSTNWWNMNLAYSGETATGSTWRLAFNVQNLFDRAPLIVPSTSTRFAIQGLAGDTYGRRYNLSMNYSF